MSGWPKTWSVTESPGPRGLSGFVPAATSAGTGTAGTGTSGAAPHPMLHCNIIVISTVIRPSFGRKSKQYLAGNPAIGSGTSRAILTVEVSRVTDGSEKL